MVRGRAYVASEHCHRVVLLILPYRVPCLRFSSLMCSSFSPRFPRGLHSGCLRMVIAVADHACGLLVSMLYKLVCLRMRLLLLEATCQLTRVGSCQTMLQWTGFDVDDDALAA